MTGRFDILETPIDGLKLLQRKPIGDARGYLERMYCFQDLSGVLVDRQFVQINHTKNFLAGTVRGMHFQYAPHAECKLVSCLRGVIFDVAVDFRPDSPSFLKWHGEVLSEDNHRTLMIPEGFAHGFQAMTEECEVLYLSSAYYQPESEGALNATDPRIGIHWPLPISSMSEKDRHHPYIDSDQPMGGM